MANQSLPDSVPDAQSSLINIPPSHKEILYELEESLDKAYSMACISNLSGFGDLNAKVVQNYLWTLKELLEASTGLFRAYLSDYLAVDK